MNLQLAPSDPLLIDSTLLQEIASEPIIRRGIAYFKEHRVVQLGGEAGQLWASVAGSDSMPYEVRVQADEEGELNCECDCPFDWEPVCKHIVAALLAYGDEYGEEQHQLSSAREKAIKERKQRGRTQVKIQHVMGFPHFGIWSARSHDSVLGRSYEVHIRSAEARQNYCTCPDFRTNLLGTCKHVEAVLHRLGKSKKSKKPAQPFIYLAWDVPDAPRICLVRHPTLAPGTERILDRYFDTRGFLRGNPATAFFQVRDALSRDDGVMVGPDAREFAEDAAREAEREVAAERITQEITRTGGCLPGIQARLYPYQVKGVAHLAARERALLADDMGLGKTLQAIAAATWLIHNAQITRILVVCPASLKGQWAREITRFTGLAANIIAGPPQQRRHAYQIDAPFHIINYELVLRDHQIINERLGTDLVILDEAQRLKNWRTKVAASVGCLSSRYLFALSGTPLENRLEDLYSLMQLIDPRILGPLWRYMIDFHITNERGKVLGYRNLSELRRRVAPVMLRRDRRLVRDQLPDRIEQSMDVPMNDRQQQLHDEALNVAAILAARAKKRALTPMEENQLMAALQRARMACNAAGLVDKETKGSPKLDELSRLLEELCIEGGLKAVVFSQWERMTAMAQERATALGIRSVRLHGGVPSKKRPALMDQFQEDPETLVFFSTDAGGVGLNLQAGSVLINLDMPWNPAILEQRIARIHRLGQKQKVQVVLLLAEDSYEQHVAGLVAGKRELFVNVVSQEAQEEVVGVGKGLLATLLEDLTKEDKKAKSDEADTPALSASTPAPDLPAGNEQPSTEPTHPSRPDETAQHAEEYRIRQAVMEIESLLGDQLERILTYNGGLLVVVLERNPTAESIIANLDSPVTVALLDVSTFRELEKMGELSPLLGATLLVAPQETRKVSPFIAVAERKVNSARLLLEAGQQVEGVGLLANAMVAALCARKDRSHLPAWPQVPVWAYGEALREGILNQDEAARLTRAHALASASHLPSDLAHEVLVDAQSLLASLDISQHTTPSPPL